MAADREVAQAEALLAQAEGAVPLLRAALEAQMNRLDVLMGAQPGADAAELADAAALPAIPRIVGRRRRPASASRRHRRRAPSGRRQRSHRRGDRRVLSQAVALRRRSATKRSSPRTCSRRALSSRWRPPACAGGCSTSAASTPKSKAADAASREALLNYRNVVLRAAEEVEDACANLVQLEAHARDAAKQIKALKRARDDSQEAYKGGLIALTDVLDADRQLLAAQDDLPRTQTDAARAAVSLFRASGGGW